MQVLPSAFNASWLQRRYSYAAVVGLTGLSLLFPAQAGLLVGIPVAMGMVVLGVAHGACDQLVVPTGQEAPRGWADWRSWLRFLSVYLGLAAVVGLLWRYWPAATVAGFFLLTIWHWGSADAPAHDKISPAWWLIHGLSRGLLLFAVPLRQWPTETADIVNNLLGFAGAAALGPETYYKISSGVLWLVIGGHLLLWMHYALRSEWELLLTELLEVLLLSGLLLAVPPRLSVGIYFVFWHSLQHVLRLTGWLGYAPGAAGQSRLSGTDLLAQLGFFLRRAAPLLLLSCVALLVLGRLLSGQLPNMAAWFSLALVVASIVTLPHALLVTFVMDAQRWRKPS